MENLINAPKEKNKRLKKFVLIFIAIGAVASIHNALKPKKPEKEKLPTKDFAFVMAQHYVEDQLKAPKSAEFSCCEYTAQINEKDSTYIITSYVDATNSFNAKLRTNWTAKMKYVGDGNWKRMEITLQ